MNPLVLSAIEFAFDLGRLIVRWASEGLSKEQIAAKAKSYVDDWATVDRDVDAVARGTHAEARRREANNDE